MKKRLAKKKVVEIKVARLMAENALLIEAVSRQTNLIEELFDINSRNAEATNKELDSLRKEIAKLKAKKPWWKR